MTLETDLKLLISQRDAIRAKDQLLTNNIIKLRSKTCGTGYREKWLKAVEREKIEAKEKKSLRLRLVKALKLLKYKNGDIARICQISKHRISGLKYTLDRLEIHHGEWGIEEEKSA